MKYTLIGLMFLAPTLLGATVVDVCNQEFEYTKTSDFSDSRVVINFENSDHQIDATSTIGYVVFRVGLDVDDDGHSGYHTYASSSVNNFNPNPGNEINSAKVFVRKLCTPIVVPPATTTTPPVSTTTPPTSTSTPEVETPSHSSRGGDRPIPCTVTRTTFCSPAGGFPTGNTNNEQIEIIKKLIPLIQELINLLSFGGKG